MYLLDTNILLELLLKRHKYKEVEAFLRRTPQESPKISDFSLYSMGIVLFGRKMHGLFSKVVNYLLKQRIWTGFRVFPGNSIWITMMLTNMR